MAKKTFLTALFICMAVFGAEAQKNNVYKTDTIVDEKGNTIVNVYRLKNLAEGNGNVVTQDFEVTEFEEISMILPATVNYTVADDYSCRVTLDENLFEYLDIYSKEGCLKLEMFKTLQQINLMPTKFVIEISAPTIEEISIAGSGEICFVTPFEARRLEVSVAGSGGVCFNEIARIQRFKMNLAGSGKLKCQEIHANDVELGIAGSGKMVCKNLQTDYANLGVAGSGEIIFEAGRLKSADVSVHGTGSVETRCQMESMDYSIAGSGTIEYYGDVKVKGSTMGTGRIRRIDSKNIK